MTLATTGSLLPAIFGVIGVAVGAMLTGVVDWIREAQRERRRTRAGARLLRSDLFLVSRMLRNAMDDQAMPGFVDVTPRSWLDQRDLLASKLTDDEWVAVASACSRLQSLAEFVDRLAKPKDRGRLRPEDLPRIERMFGDVVKAHDALCRAARDQRSYEIMLKLDPPLPRVRS